MISEPKFRHALALFQQRITYVNAYATDFQVPTQTAAFLAHGCDTIHHRVDAANSDDDDDDDDAVAGMIALVVETTKKNHEQQQQQPEQWRDDTTSQEPSTDDSPSLSLIATAAANSSSLKSTATLARELDALGWTKVFCDTRKALRSIPRCCCCFQCKNKRVCDTSSSTCSSLSRRSTSSKCEESLEFIAIKADVNSENGTSNWDEKTRYTSSELLAKYNVGSDDRVYFPAGHLILVSETKTVGEMKLTAAGRPLVDDLARRLVQGILLGQEPIRGGELSKSKPSGARSKSCVP
jgi:hypothetical protein